MRRVPAGSDKALRAWRTARLGIACGGAAPLPRRRCCMPGTRRLAAVRRRRVPMKPSEVLIGDPAPQRVLIARAKSFTKRCASPCARVAARCGRCTATCRRSTCRRSTRRSRCGSCSSGSKRRIRMLVDDARGWKRGGPIAPAAAAFPARTRMRVASDEDPVGDDACVLVDDHATSSCGPRDHDERASGSITSRTRSR